MVVEVLIVLLSFFNQIQILFTTLEFSKIFWYSSASHNADFGDKEYQSILKTYCELLYRDLKEPCICKFLHSLYFIKSVNTLPFWNCVSVISVLKGAVYNEVILYFILKPSISANPKYSPLYHPENILTCAIVNPLVSTQTKRKALNQILKGDLFSDSLIFLCTFKNKIFL